MGQAGTVTAYAMKFHIYSRVDIQQAYACMCAQVLNIHAVGSQRYQPHVIDRLAKGRTS